MVLLLSMLLAVLPARILLISASVACAMQSGLGQTPPCDRVDRPCGALAGECLYRPASTIGTRCGRGATQHVRCLRVCPLRAIFVSSRSGQIQYVQGRRRQSAPTAARPARGRGDPRRWARCPVPLAACSSRSESLHLPHVALTEYIHVSTPRRRQHPRFGYQVVNVSETGVNHSSGILL